MKKDKNKQLLIIDDDLMQIKKAKNYFESKGYKVDFAINVSQAIRMLPVFEYHLIIVNYNFSDLNGLDFLEIIAKSNYAHKVNVIMLSGNSDNKISQKALQLGAKEVFFKDQSNTVAYENMLPFIN